MFNLNKKILIILILGIIIIILIGGLIFYKLYSPKNNLKDDSAIKLELDEDFLELEGGPIVGPYAVVLKEIADIMAGCERPINFGSELYSLFYFYSYGNEEDKKEGKYEGLRWLNEEEEIELIKNSHSLFFRYYNPKDSLKEKKAAEYFPGCLEAVNTYLLSMGFTSNDKNNYQDAYQSADGTDSEVRWGFEKDNIKCVTDGFFDFDPTISVSCGDISDAVTPSEYREIYKYLNPSNDWGMYIDVYKVVDNFALVTKGWIYNFFGAWAILQREGEKWVNMFGWYQDLWECYELLEADVPPSLFELEQEGINDECYGDVDENYREQKYKEYYQEKMGNLK